MVFLLRDDFKLFLVNSDVRFQYFSSISNISPLQGRKRICCLQLLFRFSATDLPHLVSVMQEFHCDICQRSKTLT